MKRVSIEINGQQVIVDYRTVFRHSAEIAFVEPFLGLKTEAIRLDDDANLFDEVQAENAVKEEVTSIMKKIPNVIKYRKLYQEINDVHTYISDIMWNVLKSMESINSRDKFSYHLELQSKIREEFEKLIKELIPEIDSENEEEFLVHPSLLTQILTIV